MKKPIPEMIETPGGEDIMLPAFLGCVGYIYGQEEERALFLKHTGIDIAKVIKSSAIASPINKMIDDATGYTKSALVRFMDWVVVNHWGREPGSGGAE